MSKQISNATRAAIQSWSGSVVKTAKNATKAVDGLLADNIVPEDMFAPAKGEDRAFYESLTSAVIAGFTADVQSLLRKETKTLKDDDKQLKRYWQQQVGSGVKDLRRALERRLKKMAADEAGEDGEGEGDAAKAQWEDGVREKLATIVKQAQKKEASTITNMAEFLKCIGTALALIPSTTK